MTPDQPGRQVRQHIADETCQWCGAHVVEDNASARRIRRRWIASIAAAITFLVTQFGQIALGGDTLVETAAEAVE